MVRAFLTGIVVGGPLAMGFAFLVVELEPSPAIWMPLYLLVYAVPVCLAIHRDQRSRR
jgi:hypothetical protein